ncbi:sensor histidine kinase [Spirosoma fluviale]|uniref:sensor histidine kinase n=1 Tax=Spirosoma fluviale TaxID=1597977 RepID=UPI0015C7C063|nr:PAS domain S-box protein [Spirosoma fluviale]
MFTSLLQALEKGAPCSLTYSVSSSETDQLNITPLDEGYQVQKISRTLSEPMPVSELHFGKSNPSVTTSIPHSNEVGPANLRERNEELEKQVIEQARQVKSLSIWQNAILNYTGQAILTTDSAGIIQTVNQASETLLGYSAQELCGWVVRLRFDFDQATSPVLEFCAYNPDESSFPFFKPLLVDQKSVKQECIFLNKQGTKIHLTLTVSRLDDENGLIIGYVGIASDVSALNTAKAQLQSINQRLQVATQAANQGIWEYDISKDLVIWDDYLLKLHGLPTDTPGFSFERFLELIHPDDRSHLLPLEQTNLQEDNVVVSHTSRRLRADGEVFYVEISGRVMQDDQGKPSRLMGVAWDVTPRKLADDTLRASELRYRLLVDHLDTVVFQTDLTGCWTYLNPAWETITGFSIDETTGGLFLDWVLPNDRDTARLLYEEALIGRRTTVRQEVRFSHKEGGYGWFSLHAQLLVNENHTPTGFTGTLTDITDRKTAEEAMLESSERFREIAENVDELFWVRDGVSNRFLYVNPAYEKFTGLTLEDLNENPLSFLALIVEEDRPLVLNAVVENEWSTILQYQIRHADGGLRWLKARGFEATNEAGKVTRRIGVATDITTTIEKQHLLEESLQKEQALNALKSQFIATASHEFRTPLTAISSSVELMRFYVEREASNSLAPLISKHLNTISSKVISLDELIGDTLAISKLEEGKIQINLEDLDIAILCWELVKSTFSDRQDRRQVELETTGTPTVVTTDKKLLQHVLTNLLSNAFKFSAKNPRLKIRYTSQSTILEVIDEGIGIPKADLPNLFGKFFRATNASQFKGTGLGLVICQEYLKLLNGGLNVISTEGIGTTFTVTIPYARNHPDY